MSRVMLTGTASNVGRALAVELLAAGHEVYGMDKRGWDDPPEGLHFAKVDLRKRAAEDFVRRARPEAIVHLATVTHLFEQNDERYRINLAGTRAVFDYASEQGVEHVVFVGRHTYYGAGADESFFHREEEPPGQVGNFPELADLVAADLYASTALWRLPKVAVTLLRVTYTLGPSGRGTLAAFLRARTSERNREGREKGYWDDVVPLVMGYDPMFQFLHEKDLVAALALCVEKRPRGVFNVGGPAPLPLSVIAREAGRRPLPIPEPLLRAMLGKFGLPKLSAGALEHIKYPITVDDSAFRTATGYAPAFGAQETLDEFRMRFPIH